MVCRMHHTKKHEWAAVENLNLRYVKSRIATSPHAQNISVNHTVLFAGAIPDSTEANPTTASRTSS